MLDVDLYIACLVLRGRRALVVGAGTVGLEKIEGLLTCEADVKVVALAARPEVMEMAAAGKVELVEKAYQPSDLDGCFLAVAATQETELNTQIYREAESRSMLVNVVDVPDLCNFILPAVQRTGPIAVAISTSGASPALAKRMKREAAEMFGPEYAELAFLLDEIRDWAKRTLPTYEARKVFFEEIVNGYPDPIAMLKEKDVLGVRNLIDKARRNIDPTYNSQLFGE
ncbi:MAG: precorrin-2 dehydrogenase [Actinomycetota bacterium]|jgi:siroheme synthase-like protein|nr:precorrin-2 dehydrogenase [Actinomycetota bacterium]